MLVAVVGCAACSARASLSAEVGEAVGAEDPRGEEAVDQGERLTPRARTAICRGRSPRPPCRRRRSGSRRRNRSVPLRGAYPASAVGCGRWRSGRSRAAGRSGSVGGGGDRRGRCCALHLGLHALELLVGDQGLVALVGLDPFLGAAANHRPVALLVGAEVEPVPVEAPGVGRVFEHRADRRLRPLAGGVALGVDVARRGGTAGAVQVVGDLLVAGAGKEEVEHLGNHRRPLGVGDEARLLVAGLGSRRVGMRLMAKPIAVGRPAAVAVALLACSLSARAELRGPASRPRTGRAPGTCGGSAAPRGWSGRPR